MKKGKVLLLLAAGMVLVLLLASAVLVIQSGLPNTTLQRAAWTFAIIGAMVAGGSLLVSALANQSNATAQRARFWLDLRSMFAEHDEVHRKLQRGGDWYRSNKEPSDPQERAQVIPYLGLLEQCKIMMDEDLLDQKTFTKLHGYRLRLILQNGPIKRHLLKDNRFPDFKALVSDLNDPDEPKWKLQEMLDISLGGYYRALTYSPSQQVLSRWLRRWVEEVGYALKSWADRAVRLQSTAETLPDSWWTVLGAEWRESYQQFFHEFAELERQEQKEDFQDAMSSLSSYVESLTSKNHPWNPGHASYSRTSSQSSRISSQSSINTTSASRNP